MKIIITALINFMFVISFVSITFAENNIDNDTGGVLTIPGTSSPGPDLSFTPSPSSLISVSTGAMAFTITSASSKTTTDNGIEYRVLSNDPNIYQKSQATNNVVTAAGDTPGEQPSEDWAIKGGSHSTTDTTPGEGAPE